MIEPPADKPFEQVVQKIAPYSQLLRAWSLKGGVSAEVTALEIKRPNGQIQKLIVRRHGEADRTHNPHIAADEYKLLSLLHSAGLAVPAPYYLDQSGEIFPTPYVVIEYVEGASEFAPANSTSLVLQLATQLASIHRLDCATLDISFLPQQNDRYARMVRENPAKLDQSLDEARIRTTLQSVWPLAHKNKSVLLHGDFWPGNILWNNGRLVAIIDWEDAAIGDPLADVANSRLELMWAFGVDAMHKFTQHYQSLMPIDFTDLAYWELCAALRPVAHIGEWGLEAATEKTMRDGLRWFIDQAFETVITQ